MINVSGELGSRLSIAEVQDLALNPEWWYLALAIVPIVCIAGNVMVVAAVWTTRSLQTPTNHLLVPYNLYSKV